jgi:hypothetical protein
MESLVVSAFNYGDGTDTDSRLFVICRHPESSTPETFWVRPNIVFFRSTGTSNKERGFEWLRGTFLPTTGLSCSEQTFQEDADGNKTIYIEKIVDFGCNENEEIRRKRGHISKMSDYTNIKGDTTIFIGLESFLHDMIAELDYQLRDIVSFGLTDESIKTLIEKYPDLIHTEKDRSTGTQISVLFNAFTSYFLTEQQLKISYLLTGKNTGLWSFKCGTFSLSDFCIKRWSTESEPMLSMLKSQNIGDYAARNFFAGYKDVNETYEFIESNGANVEFSEMTEIIQRQQEERKEKDKTKYVYLLSGPYTRNFGTGFLKLLGRVQNTGISIRLKLQRIVTNKKDKDKDISYFIPNHTIYRLDNGDPAFLAPVVVPLQQEQEQEQEIIETAPSVMPSAIAQPSGEPVSTKKTTTRKATIQKVPAPTPDLGTRVTRNSKKGGKHKSKTKRKSTTN